MISRFLHSYASVHYTLFRYIYNYHWVWLGAGWQRNRYKEVTWPCSRTYVSQVCAQRVVGIVACARVSGSRTNMC